MSGFSVGIGTVESVDGMCMSITGDVVAGAIWLGGAVATRRAPLRTITTSTSTESMVVQWLRWLISAPDYGLYIC